MTSRDEALRIAREYLENTFADDDYTFVMLPELTEEHRAAWTVVFDTQEHIDTGDITKAPFMGVLVVPKNGSQPRFPPSLEPLPDFLDRLENEQ